MGKMTGGMGERGSVRFYYKPAKVIGGKVVEPEEHFTLGKPHRTPRKVTKHFRMQADKRRVRRAI